jgi:hypothetical protein
MRHINLLILFYCATMASMATAREAGDPAFSRLAASHDAEIPIAIGRVVVKQSGLNAIRSTLARRGREQRVVIDLLLVGETVLANYAFTNRLDYRIKGSEREIGLLQQSWWAREPFRERDLSRYPDAVRFAGENPGIKYTRMLAIQGVEVITRRIDGLCAEAAHIVDAADISPQIDGYLKRIGSPSQ